MDGYFILSVMWRERSRHDGPMCGGYAGVICPLGYYCVRRFGSTLGVCKTVQW